MPAQDTTTRTAQSDAVTAKARQLAVEYLGRGRFAVASGSTPGKVHHVQAPRGERDPLKWACTCQWGSHGRHGCSHVRAAALELDRLTKRARRRVREGVAA